MKKESYIRILLLICFFFLPIERGFAQIVIPENNHSVSEFSNEFCEDKEILYLNGELPIGREVKSIEEQISSQNIIDYDVKCIVFSGLDSIPEGMSRFKNLRKIIFEYSTFSFPQTLFEDLETIDIFFYERIDLELFDKNEWWLDKVRKISLGKIFMLNLESFHVVPNLEYIDFFEVTMEKFPLDIHVLKQLKKVNLIDFSVYEAFDLSQINFKNYPYLKEFILETTSRNISGIPKGLDTSTKCFLRIQHLNLTPKEKRIISNYKNDR